MNETIHVSVILPVYNAGNFLEKCIRSILAQTLKEIEIVLINDGSTDESLEIAKRFAASDNRIRIFSILNSGPAKARNVGLENVKGKYIAFADADDWLEPDMYKWMFEAAQNDRADLVISNVNIYKDDQYVGKRLHLENEIIKYNGFRYDEFNRHLNFKYDNANWNKLYNAQVVSEHAIKFDDRIRIGEDLLFTLNFIVFTNRWVVIDKNLYNYRIHDSSIMALSKDDRVKELNLFNASFLQFCADRKLDIYSVNFKKIMSGRSIALIISFLFGYLRLPKKPGFFAAVRILREFLIMLDPLILRFDDPSLCTLRGFNKVLLKNKLYSFYSMLTLVNIYRKGLIKNDA